LIQGQPACNIQASLLALPRIDPSAQLFLEHMQRVVEDKVPQNTEQIEVGKLDHQNIDNPDKGLANIRISDIHSCL